MNTLLLSIFLTVSPPSHAVKRPAPQPAPAVHRQLRPLAWRRAFARCWFGYQLAGMGDYGLYKCRPLLFGR